MVTQPPIQKPERRRKIKKRIVLIVLAVVILLGCGIAAWSYFGKNDEPIESGWVMAQSGVERGALSDAGYYYGHKGLTYFDFATGTSAPLCSKLNCSHDSDTCDGYIGLPLCMFFQNDYLYYADSDSYGLHLYRRNAVGADLIKVCSIGSRFIEEQKSVEMRSWISVGNYLYYNAEVVGSVIEDGYSTTKDILSYIGRIHLTTGKDEVLIEQEAGSAFVELLAAQSGSVLFRRQGTVDVDSSDPEYTYKLSEAPVTLERWDEETGEITELFRKNRKECLTIFIVYGNKVYYPVKIDFTANNRGVTFAFDISTGEETMVAENASYRYYGGGYALRQVGYEEDWHLYDLKTEKALPYTLSETGNLYQYIGAYYGIDFSAEKPTVVNTLETVAVRSMLSAVKRYLKAGYVTRGEKSLQNSLVNFSRCYADTPYYLDVTDAVVIPVTPLIQDLNYAPGMFSGVAAASRHKGEALMLLNLIAEDEEFRNQLLYGKEGRDYKMEDGLYTTIINDSDEWYSMEYLSMLSFCSPIKESNTKLFFPVREGQTISEAMTENADHAGWCHYPIAFDYSGFEAELEEIGKIIGKYYCFFVNTKEREIYDPFEFGTLLLPEMMPELYDQMLQEISDAGGDEIQAELQRQLDEWLAANPDWCK